MPGGPSLQPQEVREPAGVVMIVRVLEAAVLREAWDMSQVHDVAGVHEPVNEPIPIIGGLHGNALERLPEGLKGRDDYRQLVAQSLLAHHAIVLVLHHDDTVRPMQIDAGIVLHHRTLRSVRWTHHAHTP